MSPLDAGTRRLITAPTRVLWEARQLLKDGQPSEEDWVIIWLIEEEIGQRAHDEGAPPCERGDL